MTPGDHVVATGNSFAADSLGKDLSLHRYIHGWLNRLTAVKATGLPGGLPNV